MKVGFILLRYGNGFKMEVVETYSNFGEEGYYTKIVHIQFIYKVYYNYKKYKNKMNGLNRC